MESRKRKAVFSIDDYEVIATFASDNNISVLGHVKQILISSFAGNPAPLSAGGILAIPYEQRYNKDGGSHRVP